MPTDTQSYLLIANQSGSITKEKTHAKGLSPA